MRVALYPGSFDPLTNGHLSLVQRGLEIFDKVIVAIATNPKKVPLFSVEERKAQIKEAVPDPRVEVADFHALLVQYAKERGVNVILRGLRAVSDFEFEFQLANMNRKLDPKIETIFMMTSENYFYLSSQLVREVATFHGDVSGLVPDNVLRDLQAKFPRT